VRILITGADGQLGRDLVDCLGGRVPDGGRRCALLGPEGPRPGLEHEVLGTDIGNMPVDDRDAVLTTFTAFRPELVFHGGALTAVDRCETEVDLAYAVNSIGTRHVAEAATLVGAHMVYVSTDYVFDGTSDRPYREWDSPCPTSVYGASKLAGERECRPGSTIVRTSWVCGAHGANMVVTALRLASESDGELHFINDQHGSPTFTADLAPAIVTLGVDRRPGIFHVTNSGATTWWGLVRAVLAEAGADPERVRPISTAELDPPRPAPRPANSVLDNMALRLSGLPALPDWQDGLARLVPALQARLPTA
jgi:dTDP-4-dehydrorhamnose reductase